MKRAFFVALISVSNFCRSAFAHDTWLLPDRFEVPVKNTVTLNLTSGMAFPAVDVGPKRERVQGARVRLSGRTIDITDLIEGPQSLQLETPELTDGGVATIWVVLPPRSIELKPNEVEEYLDEIDAPTEVRRQWSEMKPPRWREFYTKHQKTFVRVGQPQDDRSWSEPIGSALELVPDKDPTSLRVGEDCAVRVLKNGAAFPNFAVNAVAGGETKGETHHTDADGRVSFRLTKSGPWLLRATDVRRSNRKDADWESDFVTLTLSAKEK